MCLRCTIADWFRKNHKWTRGHSNQQDHAILWAYVKKHYLSSKSIRIYESRCYKLDQATVSIDFGRGEPNHVTMKMKHPAPSLLDYCQDFGKAMRESIKQITNWSTKCFNHRKSYYPIPELTNYGSFRYCKIKSNSSSPQGQDEHCKDEGMGEWTWAVCSRSY